jgi:peptidoglycan/LPS O-acetylase OafA/YrhL
MWLGEISYSLYLIHGFIQFAASKALGAFGIQHRAALSSDESLALMAFMLVLCLLCAGATYSRVETAWRRRLRGMLSGPQERQSRHTLRPRGV